MIDLTQIVRKNIQDLKPYSSARHEFSGSEGIFLDANENPYGILNRYPDPLQQELKRLLEKRNGVKSSHTFLGNGSDEIIDLLFRIFCEPGKDKALTFAPTYGMYQVSASINDVDLITEELNHDFNIDLTRLKPKLSDKALKLILICSPNNPTANCMSKETIEEILKVFSGIVLIDEAYIDFAPKKTILDLIYKYSNLIIIRTLSKAWGLASARIGIAYTNEQIINYLNKIKPPYNVSGPNQRAAIQTLSDPEYFQANMRRIQEEKMKLIHQLNEIDLVKRVFPSETNFILIEVNDANELYNALISDKIIIRNRNNQIRNCLRITVGNATENEKLIESLKKLNDEKSTIY